MVQYSIRSMNYEQHTIPFTKIKAISGIPERNVFFYNSDGMCKLFLLPRERVELWKARFIKNTSICRFGIGTKPAHIISPSLATLTFCLPISFAAASKM